MALWRREKTATPEPDKSPAAVTQSANSDLALSVIQRAVHAVLESVSLHQRVKCVGPRAILFVTRRRRARGIHRAVQQMRLRLMVSCAQMFFFPHGLMDMFVFDRA